MASQNPTPWVIAAGVTGLACLAAGAFMALEVAPLARSGVRARGRIVAMERFEADEDPPSCPVVEIATSSGERRRFRSSACVWMPFGLGDSVDVLYRAADPDDACIDSFWTMWLGPVILGAIGAIASALSLVLALASRHR